MPLIFIKKPTHEPLGMPGLFKFLSESCSVMSDSLLPHSPGKDTGTGSHFLLQGIFPTQRSHPGLPHYRWILYQLSHQKSLRKPTHKPLGMPDLGVPKTDSQVPPISHICPWHTSDLSANSVCMSPKIMRVSLCRQLVKRKWKPTPVFLPGESHGRRSLVVYSPCGRKESDTTERLHLLAC